MPKISNENSDYFYCDKPLSEWISWSPVRDYFYTLADVKRFFSPRIFFFYNL